jgi:glutamine amidotransferase
MDADVMIDFSEHTTVDDRVAVIATQPLTDDEVWHKMGEHEFMVFKDGKPCPCCMAQTL